MIFSTNPYRVLGVSSDSGIKDVKKNISKLKAFAKIGKEMELDYNLSFLNLAKLDRTDDLLLKSENQLNLDKNKITNSLFWFADLSPIDAVALAHLIKGDISKTIEIWDKATISKEVSLKNYSAFNNLSTLLLLNTLDDSKTDTFKKDNDSIKQIKKAIKLKNEFISSTTFNNYCESIIKSTPISSDDAQELFTITILNLFNKNFSSKELSNLFEGLDDKLKDILNVSLTETPISNIRNHIENTSDLVKKDTKSGIKLGKKLIKDTLKDIKYLKEISSPDDFLFQTISDELSNQIQECGIHCFNSKIENTYYQQYLSSFKYALSIAIGEKTKIRAKKSIDHCEKEKDANLCSYCKVESIDNSNSHSIIIYKETNRTWFPRRVEFQQATLKLFYCKSCNEKLVDKDKIQKRVAIGSSIVGLIFAGIFSVNAAYDSDGVLPLFLILGAILGILGYKIGFAIGGNFGSYTITKHHPNLKVYMIQGWKLTQPTA